MKRHAIVIGVEDYINFPRTPFAHNDVDLIVDTLTNHCDYSVQSTSIFKLSPDQSLPPAEILSRIRESVSTLDVRDTVLLYFAGHGHLEDGAGFLVLPDTQSGAYQTTALPLNDLAKELRRDQRLCFRIFDACHSGLDVRDARMPDAQGFIRAVTTDGTGWVTLAACRDDEFSLADASLGYGVFTYHLCDYIKKLPAGADVLPEYVRINIANDVFERAKALGSPQNPTLNASISGIVSLATRRPEPTPPKLEPIEEPISSLMARIEQLRGVPEIVDASSLQSTRDELAAAMLAELEKQESFVGSVAAAPPIPADEIPTEMHRSIIEFTNQQGLQPRHRHERIVELEEQDDWLGTSILASLRPRRQKRVVHYALSQPDNLPKSAVLYKTTGDSRCVPPLEVLAYVIPLQLSVCLLVSAFRRGWPPDDDRLVHLFNGYQIQRPGANVKPVKDLAPFAMRNTIEKLVKSVEQRVDQLNREL